MTRNELKYAAGWGLAVMLLTCLPYAVVWFFEPRDGTFPLLLFSSDDAGVYLAWMRQAAEGQWLFRNLFTSEPQRGIYPQLYFLALGGLSRVTGLALPLAYHLGRVLSGVAVLVLAYRLAALFTADCFERRCAFWTTALSAGAGWLFWARVITQREPVDVWQPEAFTFMTLYVNGLWCFSLALMLGVAAGLLLAERHGWPWAAGAGLCGLVLGNVHSYDVLHLALVWSGFLVVRWALERRFPAKAVGMAALAGCVALPSVAYMAWLYRTEAVFQQRADVATLSPPLPQYLLGFGLLVPLAVWGSRLLWRRFRAGAKEGSQLLLPAAWAVAGLGAAYLPFAFQRKLIMGIHLPLALLAGIALAEIARRVAGYVGDDRKRAAASAAAALGVLLLAPSPARFMLRDVRMALEENLTSTRVHPAYWRKDVLAVYEWFGRATPAGSVLLTLPTHGVLAPAYGGRAVYAGHWGETPDFEARMREALGFYRPRPGESDSALREQWLRSARITHVLWGPYEQSLPGAAGWDPASEPYLRAVHQVDAATLYEVRPAE